MEDMKGGRVRGGIGVEKGGMVGSRRGGAGRERGGEWLAKAVG